MKTLQFHLLLIFTAIFMVSCGSSDDGATPEQPSETTDDYTLIAVSDYGEVFEIGNNTGTLEKTGDITRVNDASFLSPSSLIASSDKIYAMEFLFSPTLTNNLLIYDRVSGNTQIVPLTIPDDIPGEEHFIVALMLNGSNLMAIMAESTYIPQSVKHLITIDLQDYSIADTGITFNEDTITSMKRMGSKVYVSTWTEGFIELDLNTTAVNHLEFDGAPLNGGKLALINNSELGIMQPTPGFINGAKPMKMNLTNQTLSEISGTETIGLPIVFGNSISRNQEYFNLISTNTMYFGLQKVNFQTNETTVVPINSTTVSRNLVLVDTAE